MGKGPDFEREFCYDLSRWWCGKRDRLLFWRTSNSGGGATVRQRKGVSNKAHAGDITATETESTPLTRLITFELKAGYSKRKGLKGNLHDLIDKTTQHALYEEWIDQARAAAVRAGSPHWMLIHKRDWRRPMCFFPSLLYAQLSVMGCFTKTPVPFLAATVRLRGGKETISFVGMGLTTFLALVDPEDVVRLVTVMEDD